MRRTYSALIFLTGAAAVNLALFLSIGAMNLGGTEEKPSPQRRYRLFTAERLRPRPPTRRAKGKVPKPRARKADPKPRPKAHVAQASSPRPASPRSALRTPAVDIGTVPVAPGIFEPGLFTAPALPAKKAPQPAVRPEKTVFSARELDRPPEALHQVQPAYPDWAAEQGITGYVKLRFLVDPRGVPREIRVLKWTGNEEFADAARKAVTQWRFRPGTRREKPVSFWCRITIHFQQ